MISFRDLKTLAEFARVVELEREIWGPGYDDAVPVTILAVSVLRGGVLIGAFDTPGAESRDNERMIGFVYSLPGIKHGKAMQWSHMLGVVDEFRSEGIGFKLKMLQRDRTMAMGLDLIEWTYDPMQAMNAHLNFAKLGVVVEEYEENVYGESSSPLHKGNPTDRFVAEWWLHKPHVERRLAAAERSNDSPRAGAALSLRAHEVGDAPRANRTTPAGEWMECADINLDLDARRLLVEIPMGFTDMLSREPDVARAWRMATRKIFTWYFSRGYRAVDFFLDRAASKGTYLLAKHEAD